MQIVFQVYLPSALFVIVSWVSFIIHPDVVPGRMGLLITTFLVLINIFNGAKSGAPTSISLNAVDLYLVVCIGLVFAALLEYAIVLFWKRNHGELGKPKMFGICRRNASMTSVFPQIHNSNSFTMISDYGPNNVDSLALILFPIVFVLFNITYCSIYL